MCGLRPNTFYSLQVAVRVRKSDFTDTYVEKAPERKVRRTGRKRGESEGGGLGEKRGRKEGAAASVCLL